jgi:hypothetical protein
MKLTLDIRLENDMTNDQSVIFQVLVDAHYRGLIKPTSDNDECLRVFINNANQILHALTFYPEGCNTEVVAKYTKKSFGHTRIYLPILQTLKYVSSTDVGKRGDFIYKLREHSPQPLQVPGVVYESIQ